MHATTTISNKCPKCGSQYDDSWVICLSCSVPLKRWDKKDAPDADSGIFDREFPVPYYPQDGFYDNWDSSDERLRLMAQKILEWLKIGSSELSVKYLCDMNSPGIYAWTEGLTSIFIDEKYSKDPFQVGAILAHECMHHYMRKHGLEHHDVKVNELKTDIATIRAGLGILVINGMYYRSRWYFTILALCLGGIYISGQKTSFGYYNPHDYCGHFTKYLKAKSLDVTSVIGYIRPQARAFLSVCAPLIRAAVTPKIIKEQELKVKRNIAIQAAAVVLFILLVMAGYKNAAMIEKKTAQEFSSMKNEIYTLERGLDRNKNEIDRMEKDLEFYKNIGDDDKYNNLLVSYDILIAQMNKGIKKHALLVQNYNKKVVATNARMKKQKKIMGGDPAA